MNDHGSQKRLHPKLISFDVFGTLISVRDSSYGVFERILSEVRAHQIDVRAFWEHWEHRNIAHYWDPYRSYREICQLRHRAEMQTMICICYSASQRE